MGGGGRFHIIFVTNCIIRLIFTKLNKYAGPEKILSFLGAQISTSCLPGNVRELEVPSLNSSPNFDLGVFFRNHCSTVHAPQAGMSLNKSCSSVSVGIKYRY